MSNPQGSPPLTTLSLPKKRPALSLPTNQPHKRRKPSIASASSHPLRQTSFPPSDRGESEAYSPGSFVDDVSDDDLASAVTSTANGPASAIDGVSTRGGRGRGGRGRGRGRGRAGRPRNVDRTDTLSAASGETGRAGAAADDAAADEDAEEDDDDADGLDGDKLARERLEEEKERRAMFLGALAGLATRDGAEGAVGPDVEGEMRDYKRAKVMDMARVNAQRYELWNRIHLKKDVVRRLTNQTLSQSVPGTVVTAISAYTKVFAGEIVDRALQVQMEWTKARLDEPGPVQERDIGPLLPDHLREAMRRYKADGEGGVVGFTGLSLEGRERTAARNGGRRLFR